MRTLFSLLLLVASASLYADDIKNCAEETSSSVSYEDDVIKVTFVRGERAEANYTSMTEEEQPPRWGTIDLDYTSTAEIVVKYSNDLTCWKTRVPRYTEAGEYLGVSDCYSYSCNEVEWK